MIELWFAKFAWSTIAPIALILVGFLVEKHFIGRIAMFTNSLAINIHLYEVHNNVPWLNLYADAGLVLGIIAIISYSLRDTDYSLPLGQWFYLLSWLYCSIIAGIIVIVI